MNQISPAIMNVQRWIGKIEKSPSLPSFVFIGGVHGNELTGVRAIEQVFKEIEEKQIPLNGNVYGLRGNLRAISQKERFIDIDLNRVWTEERLAHLLSENTEVQEKEEIVELKEILDTLIENTKAPLFFMDLHTTSSESPPFAIFDDTLRNRALANALPVTKVLGIIEKLQGTILSYFGDKGPVTLVFEAGSHDAQSSLERHKAAIWLCLAQCGIIDSKAVDIEWYKDFLAQASSSTIKIVEAKKRHELKARDHFEMKPGFKNFSPLNQGDLIAKHNGELVRAEEESLIFMPLYQEKGEDGFFIVTPIHPFWLNLSSFLRQLKLDGFFHLLPGIQKDPNNPQGYIVNRSVASFKSIEFLHLFGFRRIKEEDSKTYMYRRPFDLKGPWD